jgi:hypothetical protein
VALLALLAGSPAAGLLIGGVFGLVRALPSVLMAGVRDRAGLHTIFKRVESWTRTADVIARVALAAGAVALGAAALGS